jgi:hypothetical protein
MPFFIKFSIGLLATSLALGQGWLHDSASQAAVESARSAIASCPSAWSGRAPSSSWDVVRAADAVRLRRLASATGLVRGC